MQGFCFRPANPGNHRVRKLYTFNFFKGCSNGFTVIRAFAIVTLVNYLTCFIDDFIIFSITQ